MPEDSPTSSTAMPPTFREVLEQFGGWCKQNPLGVILTAGLVATVVYFFGFYDVFTNGTRTTARWAAEAWNPENNQEHSFLVLPISAFLIWYHRAKLAAAVKQPSNLGLVVVAAGILCFVLGIRALQPRIAIFAFPLLVLGSVWFLWGRQVARVFLFPCVFMLFMIPIGGIVQGTVSLQILVTAACNVLSPLVGVKIEASGTTIRSLDGSFNFEIAEGCSGIRSLMAMMTLTALYVHFTQRELWKKGVIFCGSLVFAVIGNIGRIFTVILVAKFISPELAGGLYHDYSGFIFFPIAVGAMVGFSNLLNYDWKKLAATATERTPSPAAVSTKQAGPISYDY